MANINKTILCWLIGFGIGCMVSASILKYQNNTLIKEKDILEQENTELKWELNEVDNVCQGDNK